ncbi:MAG: hypothetical protein ACRD3E_18205, partial [Terriglobales bacterium]
ARTGCTQVHLSASKTICDPSTHARSAISFVRTAISEDSFQVTDPALVREVADKLLAIGQRD